MSKEEREYWKKHYQHLEYYPHPEIHCHCPCKGKIKVRAGHLYGGIPRYIGGHNQRGKILPKTQKIDPEVEAILRGEKEAPFCGCDCGNRIVVKFFHHSLGIPKFISGHHTRHGNSPFLRPDVAKKQQESFKDPIRNKKIGVAHTGMKATEMARDAIREGHGYDCSGPSWYLSFRDFVLLGVYIYQQQYMRVSRQIKEVLKEKRLVRLDVILAINFGRGHSQSELSKKYKLSKKEVFSRLKKFEETFPTVFQGQIFAPSATWRNLEWTLWHKIVEEF